MGGHKLSHNTEKQYILYLLTALWNEFHFTIYTLELINPYNDNNVHNLHEIYCFEIDYKSLFPNINCNCTEKVTSKSLIFLPSLFLPNCVCISLKW